MRHQEGSVSCLEISGVGKHHSLGSAQVKISLTRGMCGVSNGGMHDAN